MKIGVIGCGNMASAILRGVLKSGIAKPEDILAADPFVPAREKAERELGIKTTASNADALSGADLVLLSVKPQVFPQIAPELSWNLAEGQVVLSIMAGKSLAELANGLGDVSIVRAMPNMPALVGWGKALLATARTQMSQKSSWSWPFRSSEPLAKRRRYRRS